MLEDYIGDIEDEMLHFVRNLDCLYISDRIRERPVSIILQVFPSLLESDWSTV